MEAEAVSVLVDAGALELRSDAVGLVIDLRGSMRWGDEEEKAAESLEHAAWVVDRFLLTSPTGYQWEMPVDGQAMPVSGDEIELMKVCGVLGVDCVVDAFEYPDAPACPDFMLRD